MIEVLKQALRALDNNRQTHYYCEDTWYSCPKHHQGCSNDSERDECNCGADEANIEIDAATTALRQAIAELKSQEPVCDCNQGQVCHICDPITPSQRTWVGLEGEEIRNLWEEATKPDRSTMTMVTSFARAIEAKLKLKNGYAEEKNT